MGGDFVGRDASGVPASGKNLGTASLPWGTGRFNSLVVGGNTFDPSQATAPQNIVISGRTRTTSNQPQYLKPNGAANSATVEASTTDLVVDINGTQVTVSSVLTATGLSVAPGTNNTALVNDTDAAGQEATRTWGEYGVSKKITIGTVGSNISALVGKFAAFKIVSSGQTEYFMAFVESATVLSKCLRGFFYDSTYAPKNRIKFSHGDTITLMSLGWVFLQDNGSTLDVSYTVPKWGFEAPSPAAAGDYWFDFSISQWKRYDGASFVIVNRTLLGNVVLDSTNCVAARSWDFYDNYRPDNLIDLEVASNTVARSKTLFPSVNVAGNKIQYNETLVSFDITADLAASADMYNGSEQASTYYYCYVKDTGETALSDISPYFRPDFYGFYHPHNPWRCIGTVYNNSGSNFESIQNERASEWAAVVAPYPAPGVTHTDVTLACAAVAAGSKVKVLAGSYGALTIAQEVVVEGAGRSTIFSNVTFSSTASYADLEGCKITGTLTFASGAVGNRVDERIFVPNTWTSASFVDSNTSDNQNSFQAMKET